jgi:AhpD family alkylhydroperoxidase
MSRFSVPDVAPELYQAFTKPEMVLRKGPLDPLLRELVKIRASQLNGCLFCLDMHIHEALEIGENQERIFQLPAWRESSLYSLAERVALAYTEAVTEQPDSVSDELWEEVAATFKPEEIAHLVGQVAMINLWNRIGAPTHSEPKKRD